MWAEMNSSIGGKVQDSDVEAEGGRVRPLLERFYGKKGAQWGVDEPAGRNGCLPSWIIVENFCKQC